VKTVFKSHVDVTSRRIPGRILDFDKTHRRESLEAALYNIAIRGQRVTSGWSANRKLSRTGLGGDQQRCSRRRLLARVVESLSRR